MKFKSTTLVCIDCVNIKGAIRAMEKSLALCSFDDVKFFTSEETDYPHVKINKINNLAEYSLFAIKELWKHINTDYLLIVQHDGWILNPDAWDDAWYDLDYIGGTTGWTDPDENGMGGNGGFSFRSKKLMQECDKILVDHNKQYFDPEDIAISGGWDHCYRKTLIEKGFKFATRKIQDKFSLDYGIWDGQFGHHKGDLRNFKEEKVTKIVKAVYGTDQRQLDLTEYIKGLSSCFYVGNHTFLADPHINTVKYLTVEFENGEVRKYREGSYVDLGVSVTNSKKIKSAFYGTDTNSIDVTDKVNTLDNFRITNDVFGSDPHHGVVKKLKIDNGDLVKTYREHETINKQQIFEKRYFSSIKNKIDHVFYINMDESTDRRENIEQVLKDTGLFGISERIPGVMWDGDIPDWFYPQLNDRPKARRNSFGCAMAHLNLYKIAKEKGYKNFLVLEDDVWIRTDDFYIFVSNIPDDYDIAYLYHHPELAAKFKGEIGNNYWHEIFGQCGTYGHIVNSRCLDWMIENLDPRLERERHPDGWGGCVDRVLLVEATIAGLKIIQSKSDVVIHDLAYGSEILDEHANKIKRSQIEADISHHCNLSCDQCSHFSPHFKESFYDIKQFEKDIFGLSKILHSGIFHILGGEPLLNKNIKEYVRILRESKISDRVVLVTNGLLLPTTDVECLKIFDEIQISIYPEIKYDKMREFIEKNSGCLPPINYRDREITVKMFSDYELNNDEKLNSFLNCPGPDNCNFVFNGKYYLCAQSAKGHYVDKRFPSDEGINIHNLDAKKLINKLINKKTTKNPLRSCGFCNWCGERIKHSQSKFTSKVII